MRPVSGGAPRYRAILFDLFGTLVFLNHTPIQSAAGAAPPRHLTDAVERELPGVEMASFVEAVRQVTREIGEARRETHAECSSPERFRRVLLRLGIDDSHKAERLCVAHMRGLAEGSEMPRSHLELLRALAGPFRLGLVSNFDHGPTAREILRRHGLAMLLDPIVISDEFGWRKPRVEIFQRAVDELGVAPHQVLFIGDTPFDDVHGARLAGLDAVWINRSGESFPGELSPPSITVAGLADLATYLL